MKSMKYHNHHHNFFRKPEFWGLTSVGERGQIVIPAKARESLGLKKGNKLVVVSKGDKFLAMIKADELSGFLRRWLNKLENAESQDGQKSN